jgi:hypothetical protein
MSKAINQMIYLGCNASTPVDPRVRAVMENALEQGFGNPHARWSKPRGVEHGLPQLQLLTERRPQPTIIFVFN